MGSPIFRLPNELMFAVIEQLSIVDAFQLGLTCRHFSGIGYSNSLCRVLLERQAPFSQEVLDVSGPYGYAQAFRKLAKRKLAIANLEPFSAAIIAVADSHLYVNGTLLYINERELRVLQLRGRASHECECVVSIRALLDEAVEESVGTKKFKFTPLHYADGIVTCRYTHRRAGANATWLVVFHIREGWASSVRVPAPSRLFARSNRDYVVYGTHTAEGDDGFRRWVVRCYSVEQRRLVGGSVVLDRVIGSEMGANVYFDIIDGHLYALSSQTGHELVVGMADSFYYCCRMPLDDMDALQEATAASLWRRDNAEGTMDDRWTLIRLHRHEQTGRLLIVEARKEWRHGSSASRRTYYMQEVAFPAPEGLDRTACEAGGQTGDDRGTSGTSGTSGNEWGHDADLAPTDTAGQQGQQAHRPCRTPAHVHPGDDSSTMMPFTPSTCLARSYHPDCSTFVDLVSLPSAASPSCRRLCLRAGARRLRAPCPMLPEVDKAGEADEAGEAGEADGHDAEQRLYPLAQIEQQYQTMAPTTWPRAADGHEGDDALYQILNPPGHEGDVLGTWDDRSLLYSVDAREGQEKTSVLVFVTFDPSTRLPHVKRWPARRPGAAAPAHGQTGGQGGGQTDGQGGGQTDGQGGQGASPTSPDSQTLTHRLENDTGQSEAQLALDLDRQGAWLSISHKPMCQYISRGFDFGLPPVPRAPT